MEEGISFTESELPSHPDWNIHTLEQGNSIWIQNVSLSTFEERHDLGKEELERIENDDRLPAYQIQLTQNALGRYDVFITRAIEPRTDAVISSDCRVGCSGDRAIRHVTTLFDKYGTSEPAERGKSNSDWTSGSIRSRFSRLFGF